MLRILKALFVIFGVTVMLVLASLFVRSGEHSGSGAARELLAIPVPPWCVAEIEQFSAESLRDSESRLVRVEQGFTRYPYVGAVLLIRPHGETVPLPRLAFEEHDRHCAISEEFRFFGLGALEQGTRFIQSVANDGNRYFVLEVNDPHEIVRIHTIGRSAPAGVRN